LSNVLYPLQLGVAAGQINRRSGLSQATISSHLSILVHADLVTANKSGTWIFFKRNEATIDAFLREIDGQL
jgi:DNA-binding transcriptional ArsR family regulator